MAHEPTAHSPSRHPLPDGARTKITSHLETASSTETVAAWREMSNNRSMRDVPEPGSEGGRNPSPRSTARGTTNPGNGRPLPPRVRMIDPRTNPGSEEHESIERYDLEVAPRVRSLPPYLFGRINELKYRKRRDGDRRDRPGDGQSDRPSRGVGRRQALRGRARLAEPSLQRRDRRLQPAPGGRRPLPVAVRRRASTPITRSSRRSGRRKASATCAWPCWGPATRRWSPRRAFRSTSMPSRWPRPT